MNWEKDAMVICVGIIAFILGMTLTYSLQKAQIEQDHEWDIKCYIPPSKMLSNTSANIPITCYAPFWTSKTTINLTLDASGEKIA